MYSTLRKLLFLLPAETAHHFAFTSIKIAHKIPGVSGLLKKNFRYSAPHLRRNVFGIDFPNPIGLAAGFDKDAKAFKELSSFGFGFIEIGTLTPKPQSGNPKPRLFRLPKDQALINRMGFNNGGVDAAVERLKRRNRKVVIGGNIGKNKITPNENAHEDYLICFDRLYPVVDYFVVNVSSPNTPNLRELQEKAPLTNLLKLLQKVNSEKPISKPILLKIAPDLTNGQLDDIVEIVEATQIAGIVATNTTISREGLQTDKTTLEEIGAGGLSGTPVKSRATEVIAYLTAKSKGKLPIIAVGGVRTAADAKEKLDAGASLVQVYTGFVYEGPGMVKRILSEL